MSRSDQEPQARQLRQDGFTTVERLIDVPTLETLRALYDQFIDGRIDCGTEYGKYLGGVTRHVMEPHRHHPYFNDNPAITAAKELARRLAGYAEPTLTYDMLITKPPGHDKETPWHQDYAYAQAPAVPPGTPITLHTLQFWVALDDVDLSNGCMCFIPNVHTRPTLEHVVCAGDPLDKDRMLAIRNPSQVLDLSRTIACPLTAGACTIHQLGTPHSTPGNTTRDRQRRAYIFNLIDAPAVVSSLGAS